MKSKKTPPSKETMEKLRTQLEQVQPRNEEKLLEHLDVFNDAIIAIICTIMVLEIPLPVENEGSYLIFLRAIGVFLISFFIVCEFWYEHHQSFSILHQAKKPIVIVNFLFLAALSLVPMMTRWIMLEPSSLSVMNYGIVYFIIKSIQGIFLSIVYSEVLDNDSFGLEFVRHVTLGHNILNAVLCVGLILLSIKHPRISMGLYLVLPIVSFFSPDKKRRPVTKSSIRLIKKMKKRTSSH